jgi:hypothetical protein
MFRSIISQGLKSLIYRLLSVATNLLLFRIIYQYGTDKEEVLIFATVLSTLNALGTLDFGIGHGFRNRYSLLYISQDIPKMESEVINLFRVNGMFSLVPLILIIIVGEYRDYFNDISAQNTLLIIFLFVLNILAKPIKFIWLSTSKAELLILLQVVLNIVTILVVAFFKGSVQVHVLIEVNLLFQFLFHLIGAIKSLDGNIMKAALCRFNLRSLDFTLLFDGLVIFVSQLVAFLSFGLLPYFMFNYATVNEGIIFNYWWRLLGSINGIVIMLFVPIWNWVAVNRDNPHLIKRLWINGLIFVMIYGIILLVIYLSNIDVLYYIFGVEIDGFNSTKGLLLLISFFLVLTSLFGNIWSGAGNYWSGSVGALVQLVVYFLAAILLQFETGNELLVALLFSLVLGFTASLIYYYYAVFK